jgi:hypothetical protein
MMLLGIDWFVDEDSSRKAKLVVSCPPKKKSTLDPKIKRV